MAEIIDEQIEQQNISDGPGPKKKIAPSENRFVLDDNQLTRIPTPEQSAAAKTASNPYVLDDTTLSNIKKKDGGIGSSPTQSQSPLQKDTEPASSAYPFIPNEPLRGPWKGGQQPPEVKKITGEQAMDFIGKDADRKEKNVFGQFAEQFESVAPNPIPGQETTKNDIKSTLLKSPQSLANYTKERVDEIEATKKELEQKRDALLVPVRPGFSSTISTNEDLEAQYNKQIEDLTSYQNELQKNSDKVLGAILVSRTDYKKLGNADLEKLGKQYLSLKNRMSVSDNDKVLSDIADGSFDSDKEDLERTSQKIRYDRLATGSQLVDDYFTEMSDKAFQNAAPKIEELRSLVQRGEEAKTAEEKLQIQNAVKQALTDKDLKTYIDLNRDAMLFRSKAANAINDFPQVKRQQLRQDLNDAYFDLLQVKQAARGGSSAAQTYNALEWFFGDKATDEDIAYLSKKTGVPEEEVKGILDSRVSGYFGSADKAGVRVPGLLTRVAQSADETIANILMGGRRFFDTQDAGTKNKVLEDKLQNYNLRAQKTKLFDDAKNLNLNPFSVFGTMGEGIGQTAIFAAPSMAASGVAAGLSNSNLVGKLVSAAMTTGVGYSASYEDGYKEAANYTDDEAVRRAYANKVGLINGLSEIFLEPAEVAYKVGLGKQMGKDAFDAFVKTANKKGIGEAIGEGIKEFAKVVGVENLEELTALAGETLAKQSDLGVTTTPGQFVSDAIETVVTTTLTTLPLGVGAGINGGKDASSIRKEALFEAGNQPDMYKTRLESLKNSGQLTPDQYNEKVAVVNTMQNIVAGVNQITKANGESLSFDEKRDVAAQQFRIANNENLKKKASIAGQVPQLEADSEEAKAVQEQILMGASKENEFKNNDLNIEEKNIVPRGELESSMQDFGLTPEQTKEAEQFAKELSESGVLNDTLRIAIETGGALAFFKMVAQQAQNLDENNQELPEAPSDEAVRSLLTPPVVDFAIELFPKEKLMSQTTTESQKATVKNQIKPEDRITVGELIDKQVLYKGRPATIFQDGQALIAKINGTNREYELGNVDDVSKDDISNWGIEQQNSVVSMDDAGEISVRDKTYVNPNEDVFKAIVRDKDSNIISVKLQTPEGESRTFRGQVAQDLAYAITLKQISQNNEERQLNEFLNSDQQTAEEIRNGGLNEAAQNAAVEDIGSVSAMEEGEQNKRTKAVKTATTETEQAKIEESSSIFEKLGDKTKLKGELKGQLEEQYGDKAPEMAIFINKNFDNIVNQLLKNKNLVRECQ